MIRLEGCDSFGSDIYDVDSFRSGMYDVDFGFSEYGGGGV